MHYAKLIGLLLVVVMIWLTTNRPGDRPRYPNGQPRSSGSFVDGKAEGTWTWWYQNGEKMMEGVFVNGNRNGTWITWYDNGTKKSQAMYKDDKLEGSFTSWYRNGKINHQGNYEADKLEGLQHYYDTAGILLEEKIFNEGKIVSEIRDAQ